MLPYFEGFQAKVPIVDFLSCDASSLPSVMQRFSGWHSHLMYPSMISLFDSKKSPSLTELFQGCGNDLGAQLIEELPRN